MNPEILQQVLACKTLPTIPAVASRVIELTKDNNVSMKALADTITNDQGLAAKVQAATGKLPVLHVREGRRDEELLALIEEDPSIQLLVLGTASGREGPGPLVTYLVSQMGSQMRVPVTLVPGQLTPEEIDEVS